MSCSGLSAAPVILRTASSSTLPYLFSKFTFQEVDDEIGVRVIGGEDERFLARRWIDLPRQVFADYPVERLGDDLAVEAVDLDPDLVGRREEVDLGLRRVV